MASVTVSLKTTGQANVRLAVSTSPSMDNPIYSPVTSVDSIYYNTRIKLDGLASNQVYYCTVEVNGDLDMRSIGRFKTPELAPHNFTFGFVSCNSHTNNGQASIFSRLQEKGQTGEMDFFIHLGDLWYRDISVNDVGIYYQATEHLHLNCSRGQFMHSMPIYYMWDDHDYGPNDSGGESPSRDAAREFFRSYVPIQVQSSDPATGTYYSFIRGRVRFIVSDFRSERSNRRDEVTIAKRMMYQSQEDWFKSECLAAQSAGQVIIWANTLPYIAEATDETDDTWGAFYLYRQELSNWIVSNNLSNRIAIISGDAHMLAYDDGTSINNDAGLITCHAAPLDASVRFKGGPYTLGPFGESRYQYGEMDVIDSLGSAIEFRFKGVSVSSSSDSASNDVLIDQTFTLQAV